VVDSPDGTLRLDSASGLATPGWGAASALIVSNGTLYLNHLGQNCTPFSTNNRSILVTGSGSLWTNTIGNSQWMMLNDGVTNNTVTIANGARLFAPNLLAVAYNNAKFNTFVITNGGKVQSSNGGGMGGGISNSVVISGAGSVWSIPDNVVSFSGTGNAIRVERGGMFSVGGTLKVDGFESALMATSGARLALGGIWISGTRSSTVISGTNTFAVTATAASYVGTGAGDNGNSLTIEDFAVLTNVTLTVAQAAAINSRLTVASGAKLFTYNWTVATGAGTTGNTVRISGSNTLVTTQLGATYIANTGAHRNSITVESGAVMTNVYVYAAAGNASSNSVVVTNGAKLFGNTTYDQIICSGTNSFGNQVIVTGTGSLWNPLAKSIYVSQLATNAFNSLVIEAGGMVTNVLNVALAQGAGASNNTVLVNGGILQATTLSWQNFQPNDVTLTGGGQMNLGGFTQSNVNQRLVFNGGLLSVKNAVVSNTLEFVAGDGAQSATFNSQAGGTNLFAAGLVITNNAILGGSGYILATSTVYGAVSPGLTGVGALTNNGPLTMKSGASARFDVIATTGGGCDLLAVTNGALTLAGTLMPVLQTGFVPAKADRFLIVTNQAGSVSASGGFADGTRATIYAPNLTSRVGTFKVETGAQGVVLTDFQVIRANGSVIIIR
jgi:T5SS/PEP-CTERM-associated repeat protein